MILEGGGRGGGRGRGEAFAAGGAESVEVALGEGVEVLPGRRFAVRIGCCGPFPVIGL
jgi:hypothetical protein